MRHCPNPTCPYRVKFKAAAEYRDGFQTCSDCGSALVDGGPAAAPVSASAGAGVVVSSGAIAGAGAAGASVQATAARAPVHPVPWSRVAVTAFGALVVLGVAFVPLPGISESYREALKYGFGARIVGGASLTLGDVGLAPFFIAFAIVELAAALVPSWRALRTSGAAGRAKLAFPVAVIGTLIALFQAVGLARYLASVGRASYLYGGFDAPALDNPGALTTATIVASLVGGTLLLVFVGGLVTARGIGNGYALVALCSALLSGVPYVKWTWTMFAQEQIGFGSVVVALAAMAALVAATLFATSEEGRARLRTGPTRLPLSGLDPALAAVTVVGAGASTARNVDFGGNAIINIAMFVVLVACTVGGALLFNRPSRIADVVLRLGSPGMRLSDAMRVVRDALPRGVALSIAFCSVVLFAGTGARWLGLPFMIAGTTVVIATACARDLAAEWRAWRTHGALVSVWPLHQTYAADPVVASLAAEKIPVFLRGSALRSMSPFFSSYVPIEVLVPEADAERAFAHLDARLNELKPAQAVSPTSASTSADATGPSAA